MKKVTMEKMKIGPSVNEENTLGYLCMFWDMEFMKLLIFVSGLVYLIY
jgi:hypothetical protein